MSPHFFVPNPVISSFLQEEIKVVEGLAHEVRIMYLK